MGCGGRQPVEKKLGPETVVMLFAPLPLNPKLEHLLQTRSQSPIPPQKGLFS